MPPPTRIYSSLVFEVGSLSTAQLLTSCEQTVPRPHLAGGWGSRGKRAGGQRAETTSAAVLSVTEAGIEWIWVDLKWPSEVVWFSL